MPFKIEGGYVINADTGERKNKKPMSGPRLKRYLAALYANVPEARMKEHYVADSQGHTSRRGKKKPPKGLHSFIQPPEIAGVTLKAAPKQFPITDSLLGKHPQPHGILRLRSMQGKYLGVVGRRRKLVKRLKAYSPSQQRDDHGRWEAVGSALNKFSKLRLRPKVQAAGSLASSLVGAAHTAATFGHSRPHLPNLTDLIYRTEAHTRRLASQHRAKRLASFKAGFNPAEIRDAHGRWTTSGFSGLLFGGTQRKVYRVANDLYGLKRRPPNISIKTRHTIIVGTFRVYGYYNSSKHEIGVALSGSHPSLTTAHEIGHVIDHRGMKHTWNSETPEAKAWKAAVEKTPEVQQWRKWQKQGYIQHNGNTYKVSPGLFRYYLSDRELWARSFAQWHAYHSHNGNLKSELRTQQRGHLPLQWSNRNFGAVDSEITRLMRKNGYL